MQRQKDIHKESVLWQAYWQDSNLFNRNQLIEYYYSDSKIIAKHYFYIYGVEFSELDDFIQEAQVALSESIIRFKPSSGAEFLTYASYRIRGRILNSLKTISEKASYYDYQKRKRQQRRESVTDDIADSASSFQTIGEIIIRLAYTELLDSMAESENESFVESPISDEDESLNSFSNPLNPYRSYVIDDIKTSLRSRVKQLPQVERQIVELHYFGQLGFEEIGLMVGLSKTRVFQLHKKAILSLRESAVPEDSL